MQLAQALLDRYTPPSETSQLPPPISAYVLRANTASSVGVEAKAVLDWADDNRDLVCRLILFGDAWLLSAAWEDHCRRAAALTSEPSREPCV